jgi:hypothetical protein
MKGFTVSYRMIAWLWISTVSSLATIALMATSAAIQPVLAADSLFSVANVTAEATAATPTQARDRAFEQGQRLALRQLIDRIAGPGRIDVQSLSTTEVQQLVQGIHVIREHRYGTRYTVTVTVNLRPEAVRSLLVQRGIPFSESRGSSVSTSASAQESVKPDSKLPVLAALDNTFSSNKTQASMTKRSTKRPALIIPIWQGPQGLTLWDDPNPWRLAWMNYRGGSSSENPIAVPLGDLADVVDVTAQQALAGNRASLNTIARRYKAGDVVVTTATPKPDGGMWVTITRYPESGDSRAKMLEVSSAHAQDRIFSEAIRLVVAELESHLNNVATRRMSNEQTAPSKGQQVPSSNGTIPTPNKSNKTDQILVTVPLISQTDWFQVQNLLRTIPNVVSAEILSLSRQKVVTQITYSGSNTQLRAALARQGLSLQQGQVALELHRVSNY